MLAESLSSMNGMAGQQRIDLSTCYGIRPCGVEGATFYKYCYLRQPKIQATLVGPTTCDLQRAR